MSEHTKYPLREPIKDMSKISKWGTDVINRCPTCGAEIKREIPIPTLEPKTISAVNSPEVQELIALWNENNMPALSMGDKVEIAILRAANKNMRNILGRWISYNQHFESISPGKRKEMYLYQNKFSSLALHIEKFEDELAYGVMFGEHVKRMKNFNEKNVKYGFSDDPAQDKQMAIEKERMDIMLLIQSGAGYGVKFAENVKYYELKLKTREKQNESSKQVVHKRKVQRVSSHEKKSEGSGN